MQKVKKLIQNCFLKKKKTKTNKTEEKRDKKKKKKRGNVQKKKRKKLIIKERRRRQRLGKCQNKKKPKSPNVQNVCWGIFVQKRQGASSFFSLL